MENTVQVTTSNVMKVTVGKLIMPQKVLQIEDIVYLIAFVRMHVQLWNRIGRCQVVLPYTRVEKYFLSF